MFFMNIVFDPHILTTKIIGPPGIGSSLHPMFCSCGYCRPSSGAITSTNSFNLLAPVELHSACCDCMKCMPWRIPTTTGGNLPRRVLYISSDVWIAAERPRSIEELEKASTPRCPHCGLHP